jgi:hypothetical protein
VGDIEFDCAKRHPGACLALVTVNEPMRKRLVSAL